MEAVANSVDPLETFRQVATREGREAPPLLLRYAELLLQHGPGRFFGELDDETLYGFIEQRFRFAEQRTGAPYNLRLASGHEADGLGLEDYHLLEVVVDDRPFLIDSLQSFLTSRNLRILAILHPILRVERDAERRMTAVADFGSEGVNEAHITFVLPPVPYTQRQALLEECRAIMQDVIRCVDDFPALIERAGHLQALAEAESPQGNVARLLHWFQQNNFVFMGYLPFRRHDGTYIAQAEGGRGLFNPDAAEAPHREALAAQVTRFLNRHAGEAPFFVVEETHILSRMRHRMLISALLVAPQADGDGQAAVLAGIFSNRSLRVDVMEIPVVQEKIATVMQRNEIAPRSYKQREVLTLFTGLPRFELFRLTVPALDRMVALFLSVVDQPRIEAELHPDEATDILRIAITLPERQFPTRRMAQLRERVETLFNTTAQNLYTVVGSTFTVICIVFDRYAALRERLPEPARTRAAILAELQTREERLERDWAQGRDHAAARLGRTLIAGLPEGYKVTHTDAEILSDLGRLEALVRTGQHQFELRRLEGRPGCKMVLYTWEQLSLSRLMPILDNLRVVEVVEEETFDIALADRPAFLHTFLLRPTEGEGLDPARDRDHLETLVFGILERRLENDPLNALLPVCGFDWRRIGLMRLYRNYLMQVGSVYTRRTIHETLIRRPRATRALVGVFETRFDPARAGHEAEQLAARQEMEDAEREIDNLTEDRIFKALLNLILATVRTSFYQADPPEVIAVKLRSADIEQLPPPRPLFEIYVYGPLMEGIHLRGDKIARGGIRYSDRPDDFRTEVLGLMATQMKKNALIVPLGSKGGFVVKTLVPWGGDARAAGDAQYRVFIRALLSVTDNLQAGRIVPPRDVVRLDEDDPYLVVAADKGTAHLSDTANAVSREMGFWLADAFASGGSHGYDHKAVGITARGAWECVMRHFWEQGTDSQTEPVTVVGVGDMSGDVFGNGMLLSPTLRLLGAFDHRHIFLDPDPDPETSFAERQRLFQLGRSSWADYDTGLISAGGGVFPRGAKEIPLTPPLQALLGTERDTLSGEEVVRALLAAPVDLLWNGGIGTYIKASGESHADVGDPNNDAVRIDATECRARVIGEGGNLGLTQAARIEFDVAGGAVNTDAIDNAGGVNMSDHEVNLKILLGALMDQGHIASEDERNAVLADLTDEVTAHVLRANFRQTLIISMDRLRSRENMAAFLQLVELLAAEGGLDRRTECIPPVARFQQYQSEGLGVPRPVLAVLLAYSKMHLYRRLSGSPLVQDAYLQRCFTDYFPRSLVERFPVAEADHALKGHIIATVVTNTVIDQAGTTFVPHMAAFTGHPYHEVVEAYLLADTVVGGAVLRESIYKLARHMPADQQYRLLMRLEHLLYRMVRWMLLHCTPEQRSFAVLEALRERFAGYVRGLPDLLGEDAREVIAGEVDELTRMGVEQERARLLATLPRLDDFMTVSGLATDAGISVAEAYRLSELADEALRFSALEQAIAGLRMLSALQRRYADQLLRTLSLTRHAKLQAIVAHRAPDAEPAAWLQAYLDEREPACAAFRGMMGQVLGAEQPELVALGLVVNQLEAV